MARKLKNYRKKLKKRRKNKIFEKWRKKLETSGERKSGKCGGKNQRKLEIAIYVNYNSNKKLTERRRKN